LLEGAAIELIRSDGLAAQGLCDASLARSVKVERSGYARRLAFGDQLQCR
jgi:hypothetical protein